MAHIQHLTEDRSITLRTLREIVLAAADGKLPNATEKLDGVNITFTCTPKYEVRFARSDSDIKTGGMIAAVLEAKYTGRGLVQDTFVKGANAIRAAIRALSPGELKKAFDEGKLWYSAEIIYTQNPNVVRYAEDGVVLHERPVLRCEAGSVSVEPNAPFAVLERAIPDMDDLAKQVGWRLHGPIAFKQSPLTDGSAVQKVLAGLDRIGKPEESLNDFLFVMAKNAMWMKHVRKEWIEPAAKRLIEAPDCMSLTKLKPHLPDSVVRVLRESHEWCENTVGLDRALITFADVVLKGARSALIVDNERENARINDELMRSVGLIHSSRNLEADAILQKQLSRFENEIRVVTPVEGIVFTWNDKLYKLTGSFAPANAIMGLCKYGRGKAVPRLTRM